MRPTRLRRSCAGPWIPAFAGMTSGGVCTSTTRASAPHHEVRSLLAGHGAAVHRRQRRSAASARRRRGRRRGPERRVRRARARAARRRHGAAREDRGRRRRVRAQRRDVHDGSRNQLLPRGGALRRGAGHPHVPGLQRRHRLRGTPRRRGGDRLPLRSRRPAHRRRQARAPGAVLAGEGAAREARRPGNDAGPEVRAPLRARQRPLPRRLAGPPGLGAARRQVRPRPGRGRGAGRRHRARTNAGDRRAQGARAAARRRDSGGNHPGRPGAGGHRQPHRPRVPALPAAHRAGRQLHHRDRAAPPGPDRRADPAPQDGLRHAELHLLLPHHARRSAPVRRPRPVHERRPERRREERAHPAPRHGDRLSAVARCAHRLLLGRAGRPHAGPASARGRARGALLLHGPQRPRRADVHLDGTADGGGHGRVGPRRTCGRGSTGPPSPGTSLFGGGCRWSARTTGCRTSCAEAAWRPSSPADSPSCC